MRELDTRLVDETPPPTNILKVNVQGITYDDAPAWVMKLEQKGVLARAINRQAMRLVTHRHIDASAIEGAYRDFASLINS